jgi:HSP20 family protein
VKESESSASGRGALAEFKEAVTNLFEQVVGLAPDLGLSREWPRHELKVEDDGYRARVELPGFRREEIEVAMSGRTLTISGNREKFKPPQNARMLRSERPSGKFSLTIRLPAEIDTLGVVAKMREGMLEVVMPKPRGPRGRSIEVDASDDAAPPPSAEGPRASRGDEESRMPWEDGPSTGSHTHD